MFMQKSWIKEVLTLCIPSSRSGVGQQLNCRSPLLSPREEEWGEMEPSKLPEESNKEEITDFVEIMLESNEIHIIEQKELSEDSKEEENLGNEKETMEKKEDDEVPILEQKGFLEDTEEEENLDKDEKRTKGTKEANEVPVIEQKGLLEYTKEGAKIENEKETIEKNQSDSLNKESAIPKLPRIRTTVPRPFSLSSDKRVPREKPDGVEKAKDRKPKLSKSISLNVKTSSYTSVRTEQSSLVGTDRSSKLSCGTSVSSRSFTSNGRTEKQIENESRLKKISQGTESESKKSLASAKENDHEAKMNKLKKSSTFKASPLPSFYHKKYPLSKLEVIKIPLTRPKSPRLGQRSKSLLECEDTIKKEMTEKRPSKEIRTTAKETINKLITGSWRSPNAQPKVAKSLSSVSNGGKMDKEANKVIVRG